MWRAVVPLLGLVGCSSAPELTCGVLTDPASCFSQQTAALAACIPTRGTPATLSSDQKMCSFADGVHIDFYTPLPFTDVYMAQGLTMTIYAPDGSECGSLYYVESSGGTVINVNRTVWDESAGYPDGVELRCPSQTYEGKLADLDTCAPRVQLDLTAPTYAVSITGVPAPLFSCQ